jgi:nitrate reductase gamma subunit
LQRLSFNLKEDAVNGLVLAVFYGSILFCIVTSIYKLYKFSRYPLHLRWEIYRAGSVYESPRWWEKEGIRRRDKVNGTIKDIATLRDYYRSNRLYWLPLYIFHLGVFLLITWHAWLFLYAFFTSGGWMADLALAWGHTATFLMGAGALGALLLRTFSLPLRVTYPRRHYLKWLVMLAVAGTGYYAVQYYFNGAMGEVLGYVRGQLQFNMAEKMSPPFFTSLHVLSVAAVLVYLPFSHMLRLFFRYYHEWRWNYIPALRSKAVSRQIKKQMEYPVTWPAKHVPAHAAWKDIGIGE